MLSKDKQLVCRFNMSRSLINFSYVNKLEILHLKRNDKYIMSWNLAIVIVLEFNHDIQWISITQKTNCFIYYFFNYITKNDLSTIQLLVIAKLLLKSVKTFKKNFNSFDWKQTQI